MKSVKPLLLASLVSTSCLVSANEIDKVVASSDKINQSASQSQQKIDSISDTMQSRLQTFRTLNKEIEGLEIYNKQLQKQVANQLDELEALDNAMDKVSVIERQITPLMLRMIDGLESFVILDVPFLEEERSKRVERLKSMMDRADVAVSEKFRRVLEAYQIEVDYGRTIEAYQSILTVNGQEREVDFLRIGRLDLIYLTTDGKLAGIWNKDSKSFESLPDSNLNQINKALRIARKQLAPDMLVLPVPAASKS